MKQSWVRSDNTPKSCPTILLNMFKCFIVRRNSVLVHHILMLILRLLVSITVGMMWAKCCYVCLFVYVLAVVSIKQNCNIHKSSSPHL